jgi:hypothetical protein
MVDRDLVGVLPAGKLECGGVRIRDWFYFQYHHASFMKKELLSRCLQGQRCNVDMRGFLAGLSFA